MKQGNIAKKLNVFILQEEAFKTKAHIKLGRAAFWLATSARKPKVPGSTASYIQG